MKASVVFAYDWSPVEIAPGVAYVFDQAPSKYLRQTYAGPAVYRLRIRPGPKRVVEQRYIGQTVDLPRRMRQYYNPGQKQKTNIRLNKEIRAAMRRRGALVQAEVLRVASCKVNGRPVASFADHAFRRCLEELLILATRREKDGVKLLNKEQ